MINFYCLRNFNSYVPTYIYNIDDPCMHTQHMYKLRNIYIYEKLELTNRTSPKERLQESTPEQLKKYHLYNYVTWNLTCNLQDF